MRNQEMSVENREVFRAKLAKHFDVQIINLAEEKQRKSKMRCSQMKGESENEGM